ncbi:related to RPC31-DNA-directed RNA polymerase III [Serendipita indica DSM 11827]|uniref:DNA-directed RNA polymerase III subunit n=1 Tax=Serendipita indica (strain DSM 11827) TaxID=1109443 RepID=G4U0S7_SERID|nr:related to RPC31-DNA-directed RNA polymerase III [Serendipita indica DSM 11827]
MSRGRGGGAGRGSGRGRGGSNALPAGFSFEDMLAASQAREPAPLYPAYDDLPALTNVTEKERLVCKYQDGFAERFRKSPYYLIDTSKADKTNRVARYSDRYNITTVKHPTLDASNLDRKMFPKAIWDQYFEGRDAQKQKTKRRPKMTAKLNLDALENQEREEGDEEDKPAEAFEEGEETGDYDDDQEEYGDDDYVQNYFDDDERYADDDVGGEDEGGGD